jgi:hypothetical protein
MRRADHSSRGILPSVVRLWSRSLYNEEAPAQWGLLDHGKKKIQRQTWLLLQSMLFVSLCYHPFFFSQLDYSHDTVINNLKLHRRPLQGMDKVMETGAKDTHIFIKTELGHHLPVIQLVWTDSYKFWTVSSRITYNRSWRTPSSYLRDDGRGNLLLKLLSKTDHSGSIYLRLTIMLAREDDEGHLHASQTKTEHFWLCVWAKCHIENLNHSPETSGSQDAPGYLKCPHTH